MTTALAITLVDGGRVGAVLGEYEECLDLSLVGGRYQRSFVPTQVAA
ncbi:hypothetical protein ABZ667_36390 [Streptomyces lavendulae]